MKFNRKYFMLLCSNMFTVMISIVNKVIRVCSMGFVLLIQLCLQYIIVCNN